MTKSSNPAYKCWGNMIQRCHNPKHKNFKYYGGRGIEVHPLFRSFDVFLEHIGERPSRKFTIDRIDVNRGYEPGNVRWATAVEQAQNQTYPANGCIWYNTTAKKWVAELRYDNVRHALYSALETEATNNLIYLRLLKKTPEWYLTVPTIKNKAKNTKSKYLGVYYRKNRVSKWRAGLHIGNTTVHFGSFRTEEEAAKAYNSIAKEWFGIRAKLNQV